MIRFSSPTAIHWALGNEQIFINTAGDIHLLPYVLKATSNHEKKVSNETMADFIKEAGATPLFT